MVCAGCSFRSMALVAACGFVLLAAVGPVRAFADGDDAGGPSRLIAMGDFNRDGIADIVEVGAGGVLTVYLGQGHASFHAMAAGPVAGRDPKAIVAGDFNGDGKPDVIVGDDDGSLKLFLGDGTGHLVPVGDVEHFDSVVSLAVADFNHDGIPDVVVSDWRASAVTVLMGSASGSFRRGSSFPLRMPGMLGSVMVADFNGDGLPDIAVSYGDNDGYTFEVMLGDGKGSFTFAPKLSFMKDPNAQCAT